MSPFDAYAEAERIAQIHDHDGKPDHAEAIREAIVSRLTATEIPMALRHELSALVPLFEHCKLRTEIRFLNDHVSELLES